jgi:hypothetical protein
MLLPPTERVERVLRFIRVLRHSHAVQAAAVIIVLGATAWLSLRTGTVNDPDIWWHLKTGELILQRHAVPNYDTYSISGMGRPWVAYSWLCEVLFAALVGKAGLAGLAYYGAAMRLLIAAEVFDLLRRLHHELWGVLALTAAVLYAMGPNYGLRPTLFTILFFILQLDILLTAKRTRRGMPLWLLPPIYLVWANIHVELIYGLFALGLFTYEATLYDWLRGVVWKPGPRGLPADYLWWCSLGCIAATLLNPYTLRFYLTIVGLMLQSGQWGYITELLSPSFRQGSHYVALFLLMGAAAAVQYRRQWKPIPLFLLLVAVIVGFRSARDLWFPIVVAASLICGWENAETPGCRLTRAQWAAVSLVLLGGFLAGARAYVSNDRIHEQIAREYPVDAAHYLRENGIQGRLFNDYDWGGFLIWALPDHPVSIDGRANLYGDEHIVRTLDTWDARPSWSSDPDLSAAQLIVASSRAPLTAVLRLYPKYRTIYEDKVAVVFGVADGPHLACPPEARSITASRE